MGIRLAFGEGPRGPGDSRCAPRESIAMLGPSANRPSWRRRRKLRQGSRAPCDSRICDLASGCEPCLHTMGPVCQNRHRGEHLRENEQSTSDRVVRFHLRSTFGGDFKWCALPQDVTRRRLIIDEVMDLGFRNSFLEPPDEVHIPRAERCKCYVVVPLRASDRKASGSEIVKACGPADWR